MPVSLLRYPITPLWKSKKVTIDCYLTLDQMMYLRACLLGVHPDETLHYGYITLAGAGRDESGNIIDRTFWIDSVRYNPPTRKATIELRARFETPAPPPDKICTDYGLYTYANLGNEPEKVKEWLK